MMFLILFVVAFSESSPAQKRPNILLIISDGVDPSSLPPYDNTTIKTPNLSWLAENGMVLTRMFSTYGVCAPSRTALITGMYPSSIGAMDQRNQSAHQAVPYLPDYETVPPPEVKCFTEYLRSAGYYCTIHPKSDFQFKSPVTAWDEIGKTADWSHRKPDQPFFSIYNIYFTHESFLWKRQDKPLRVDPARVSVPPYFPQHNVVIRKQIARMYDNIMLMDAELGKLFNKLKEEQLMDNTIIIFTSDHNGPFPWYKREVYDRGTHIPFIVYFPDKKYVGTKDMELHSLVDMAPTILSLAGLPIPDYMQGQAFLGKAKAAHPRKYIYTARDRMDEQYDMVRAVRDKHYQYARNYDPDLTNYRDNAYRLEMPMMQEILRLKGKDSLNAPLKRWFSKKEPEVLYDVQKDPYELHNLANDAAYASVLIRMRAALNAWEKEIRDKGFMQEIDLINLMWPGLQQPVTATPEITQVQSDGISEQLKMTCTTPGASIAYRLNTDPNGCWHLYSKVISVSGHTSIQAKAVRLGYKESEETTYSFEH